MTRVFGWLVGMTLATGSATAQVNRATRLPSPDELRPHGLELSWFTHVTLDPRRDHVRDVHFDGQRLYVQTNRGLVQCLDAETGQTHWRAQVGEADRVSFSPAANRTQVFVVNGSQLFVLDKADGRVLWQMRLPNAPSGPLAASDDYVYVSFIDGHLRAYDLRRRGEAWFHRTSKAISIPALPIDDLVAFASQNGILYVSLANERRVLFQYETDSPVAAALARQGDWILMASEDYNVYSVHHRTGATRWRFTLGNPIVKPLVAIGEEMYVTPERGGMYQLGVEDGKENWWTPAGAAFTAASPQRVYAADPFGRLLIVDRKTGQTDGLLDTRRFALQVFNPHNDRIYLASRAGLFLCLREAALTKPALRLTPATSSPAKPVASQSPEKEAAPPADAAAQQPETNP